MAETNAQPPSKFWPRPLHWWLLGGVVIVIILVVLWSRGTFDRPLYSIGLNANECARNGFGATFCGKELDAYRAKVRAINAHFGEAKHELQAGRERSESEGRERESQAAEQRQEEVRAKRRELEAKMAKEKAIYEREEAGTAASDLAKLEYESARAELQQLNISGP